jgi:hypothetical protein
MDAEDLNLDMIDVVTQAAQEAAENFLSETAHNNNSSNNNSNNSDKNAAAAAETHDHEHNGADATVSQETPKHQQTKVEDSVSQETASSNDAVHNADEKPTEAEGAETAPPSEGGEAAAEAVTMDRGEDGAMQDSDAQPAASDPPSSDAAPVEREHKKRGLPEESNGTKMLGTQNAKKPSKKRVRRVGKIPPEKLVKLDEEATGVSNPSDAPAPAPSQVPTGTEAEEGLKEDADASMEIPLPDGPSSRIATKHDEKWNAMFQKLLEYKKQNNNTMVPQCYSEDQRLGRWVHYQRVEYWIYQQKGSGKITEERIARLNSIGFEWDPQKAQWDAMFEKLKKVRKEPFCWRLYGSSTLVIVHLTLLTLLASTV